MEIIVSLLKKRGNFWIKKETIKKKKQQQQQQKQKTQTKDKRSRLKKKYIFGHFNLIWTWYFPIG